jgi:hypothetical protein
MSLADLHNTLLASGCNRNDQVIMLIERCLELGLNTDRAIIGTLMKLDYKPGHVARMLKEQAGLNPANSRWRRDKDGVYHSHAQR